MTLNSVRKEMLIGMGSLLLAHILFVTGLFVLAWIAEAVDFYRMTAVLRYSLFGIGLSQLMYAIPLGLRFRQKRRFSALKGVMIGAGITALLCGGCYGFLVLVNFILYG